MAGRTGTLSTKVDIARITVEKALGFAAAFLRNGIMLTRRHYWRSAAAGERVFSGIEAEAAIAAVAVTSGRSSSFD